MPAPLTPLAPHATALELEVFHLVNRSGGRALDAAAVLLSERWFGALVGGLACAAVAWRTRAWRPVLAALLAVATSDLVGARLLRPWSGRMRPCFALPPEVVRCLAPVANVGSLPSLHAANLFALALVAALSWRRLAVPAFAAAAAVSWSRVYVGAHWPTDVLAGAAWGSLAGAAAWWLTGLIAARRAARRGG